ncbi:MAG: TetR/AcrR family transcriptional regulator [Alphaproteobacteria bacterium]
MTKPSSLPKPPPAQDDARRKRMTPAARAQHILDEAAAFFAERGLATSTRELAARLGVAQALIYRYFPSKGMLIDKVFETTFARLWDDDWTMLLANRAQPLEERVARLYVAYLERAGALSVRLFVRAGLEGADMARRYSVPLTEKLLRPMIGALRADSGLPDFDQAPMLRGERELAMAIHGAVVFLGIRKHVYAMPMPDDLSDLVRLQVRVFLDGARRELARLHDGTAEDSLTVQQLDRRRQRRAPAPPDSTA